MSRRQSERIGKILREVAERDSGKLTAKKENRYGDLLVTIEHRQAGTVQTLRGFGHTRADALRSTLASFRESEWRVRAISSPQSIIADLQGRRPDATGRRMGPEWSLLGGIGRMGFLS